MPDTFLDLLRVYTGFPTPEGSLSFLVAHPVLLSPGQQAVARGEVGALSQEESAKLGKSLKDLDDRRRYLESHLESYPTGRGPLDKLSERVLNGEITSEQAEALARLPETTSLLSPVYTRAFCYHAVGRADKYGEWKEGVLRGKLVMASVNALTDSPEAELMRREVALEWIEIVHIALAAVPDGRLYRNALAIGNKMQAECTRPEDREFVGNMLHRLGTMHLDPYTALRNSASYKNSLNMWRQRLMDELGPEINNVPRAELEMPSMEQALDLAESYFRKALPFRDGHLKGLTFKALVQTLEWRKLIGEPVNKTEVINLARQALSFLSPDRDPQQRLAVITTLQRQGESIDPQELTRPFQISLDEQVRRFGTLASMELVLHTAAALEKPFDGLELLRNSRSLFETYGDERFRKLRWESAIQLMVRLMTKEYPDFTSCSDLKAGLDDLRLRARKEAWEVRKLSLGLVALAALAPARNEEETALDFLQQARQQAPLFAGDYADVLDYLRALLVHGRGVNAFQKSKWAKAIRDYGLAISAFLEMNILEPTQDTLARIDDVVTGSGGGPDIPLAVVRALAPKARRLEIAMGEPATRFIQHACKRSVAAFGTDVNPEALNYLLQVAKGLRFATALYSGWGSRTVQDEEGSELLRQIAELETSLGPQVQTASPDPQELFDEDVLLTAYAGPEERAAGATPIERLTNLRHTYDAHLNARLLAAVPEDDPVYLLLKDVQLALDSQTVLLNYYLGATPEGLVCVDLLALTREGVAGIATIRHRFPDSLIQKTVRGRQVLVSRFAYPVSALRRAVQEDPGPLAVTPQAAQYLEAALQGYFVDFMENFDQLRQQGKTHLCIVPHGPLHFYPFHLIGKPNRPLTEEWKITYLPNLHLLLSRRGRPAARRYRPQALTSIGLSFGDGSPFNLPPMEESASEAQAVATSFHTAPVLESQATKSRVLEALQSSRYVHLSTHGAHNVEAPAFQCVYLAPEAESDGRLCAHELLSLDLRGLELITLSACETALGRFDTADNLRGLPASLLLAGASTLIGTLWPASVKSCQFFFKELYAQLNAGANRLDSFAAAQRETRENYPEYGDWGSFYFVGDWI
jgi:hypothetical protein